LTGIVLDIADSFRNGTSFCFVSLMTFIFISFIVCMYTSIYLIFEPPFSILAVMWFGFIQKIGC
jgi:hypothetical protein